MMTYDFSKTPAPYDFSKHSVVKAWDEFARKIAWDWSPFQSKQKTMTWVDNTARSNTPKSSNSGNERTGA